VILTQEVLAIQEFLKHPQEHMDANSTDDGVEYTETLKPVVQRTELPNFDGSDPIGCSGRRVYQYSKRKIREGGASGLCVWRHCYALVSVFEKETA